MTVLDDMVRQLRAIASAEAIEMRVAGKAVRHIDAAIRASLDAGKSPNGEAWAPRKKDGGKAYEDAASHLEVKAYGSLIRASISGPTAFGPYGVRGAPKRPMLPDAGGGVPANIGEAIDKAAFEVLEEMTK